MTGIWMTKTKMMMTIRRPSMTKPDVDDDDDDSDDQDDDDDEDEGQDI
jgi:hypothetical protein